MYSVTYELAHGRPYSKLEELLLRAVNEFDGSTGCTFSGLREVFLVHDRLLTEGLVTLIQEGWVAMVQQGSEVHYLITEEGRLTIEHGRRPSNLRVHTRHAKIVRERLTGQLARSSDLQLVTGPQAVRGSGARSWKKYQLTPRMQRTKINGGETEHLLPRSRTRQEWIRWIDSVARLNTDLYYLPVLVDPETVEVTGLPHQWRTLKPLILEEVAERYDEFVDDTGFQEKPNEVVQGAAVTNEQRGTASAAAQPRDICFAETSVRPEDFALTGTEGRRLVERTLDECTGNALIVAAHLDARQAAAAGTLVAALRQRGVHVDLLWSCAQDLPPTRSETAAAATGDPATPAADAGPEELVREINRLIGAARGTAGRGKLVFNRAPAATATSLVLVTTGRGPVAVIGVDPFEPVTDEDCFLPAVRYSDAAGLASVARLCAGWWEDLPGDEGSLPAHRWKHYAERWAGEAARALGDDPDAAFEAGAADTGSVRLLIGPQPADLAETLRSGPNRRFLLADSGRSVDTLTARITAVPPAATTVPTRVAGAAGGWRWLERTAGSWQERPAEIPDLAAGVRVTAGDDLWLVEYPVENARVLSFSVSGRAAAEAWNRVHSVPDAARCTGAPGSGRPSA
ncbi:hypothetical protein [Streptomyces sp. JW3]|uniref:hypothetical protein n=1 Tax=Streptomyces sp. JW3 TaxID=3456955 RepID=UPI003FA450CE